MKVVSVTELKEMLDNHEDIQLIDVREKWETEICSIEGAVSFPMSEFDNHVTEIHPKGKVIIQCHSGVRSVRVLSYLEHQLGLKNIYNLTGGISEWIRTIDPSMEDY